MNSTLKSLLFWMVLVVVGVLIWNFSTGFQGADQEMSFSDFLVKVQNGEVEAVTITGNEISGTLKVGVDAKFRTYAPAQFEGLGNLLWEKNVSIKSKPATTSPWATPYSWAPILLMIGFWIFIMRQMQSGGTRLSRLRQEPREVVVELAEEGHRSRTWRALTRRKKSSRKSSSSSKSRRSSRSSAAASRRACS